MQFAVRTRTAIKYVQGKLQEVTFYHPYSIAHISLGAESAVVSSKKRVTKNMSQSVNQ